MGSPRVVSPRPKWGQERQGLQLVTRQVGSLPGDAATGPDLWSRQVGVKGSRPQARGGPTAADVGSLAAKPSGLQRPPAQLPVQLGSVYTPSCQPTSHSWAHLPRPGHMVRGSAVLEGERAPGRTVGAGVTVPETEERSREGAGARAHSAQGLPRLVARPRAAQVRPLPHSPKGKLSWLAGSRGLSLTGALGVPQRPPSEC